jgi:hypothetical protein
MDYQWFCHIVLPFLVWNQVIFLLYLGVQAGWDIYTAYVFTNPALICNSVCSDSTFARQDAGVACNPSWLAVLCSSKFVDEMKYSYLTLVSHNCVYTDRRGNTGPAWAHRDIKKFQVSSSALLHLHSCLIWAILTRIKTVAICHSSRDGSSNW